MAIMGCAVRLSRWNAFCAPVEVKTVPGRGGSAGPADAATRGRRSWARQISSRSLFPDLARHGADLGTADCPHPYRFPVQCGEAPVGSWGDTWIGYFISDLSRRRIVGCTHPAFRSRNGRTSGGANGGHTSAQAVGGDLSWFISRAPCNHCRCGGVAHLAGASAVSPALSPPSSRRDANLRHELRFPLTTRLGVLAIRWHFVRKANSPSWCHGVRLPMATFRPDPVAALTGTTNTAKRSSAGFTGCWPLS